MTDYVLHEKKTTNISTDAHMLVVMQKHAQKETPIYACNNVSDWS